MRLILIALMVFSLAPITAKADDSEWIKEARSHCDKDLEKTFPKLYLYLMQEQLPKSMANSHFQFLVRDSKGEETSYLVPDPRSEKAMTLVPLLGKTIEKDGKTSAEYKFTKTLYWKAPGDRRGISIESKEIDWLLTQKEGLCLDLGVKPIPLTLTTGVAADRPDVVDFIDLLIKYRIADKDVQYSIDLRNGKIKGKDEGSYESEILVPSSAKEDFKFSYELRYFSKSGLKKVAGEQTVSAKSESETIKFKSEK